jgi:hypothetical protein
MTALAPWRAGYARRRAGQMAALAKPMTTVPMAGDPRLYSTEDERLSLDPVQRFVCLYASALLQQRGVLPADASSFTAVFEPPGTAVFLLNDRERSELCRFTVATEVVG